MKKARILVVEDQQIIALEIKERLEDMGHEVVAMAKSGEKAIARAKEFVPDLILMDIKIEGDIDGIETAERIKEFMDCPVIFLTAYADDKTIQRAKLTEPYAYIVKPMDERELKSAIVIALYKNELARELKESELKYRSMINSLEGIVYVVDKEYNMVAGNEQANTLFKNKDTDGKKCYELIYGENNHCRHCSIDELSNGTACRKEFRNAKTKSWNYMITSAVNLGGQNKYYQNLVVDITERKQNEDALFEMLQQKKIIIEEKNTMLREIHHRVKNNLQLMLSLIRLQESNASETSVKTNLRKIQNRLTSMALVHEDLYASTDLGRISFKNYIEKLLHNLTGTIEGNPGRIKLFFGIEEMYIPVDIAIPLGIIVNELVTNSMKHAFPGGKTGRINIRLRKHEENYILEVEDNGTGIENYENRDYGNGLGLQITDILCKQINCQLIYEGKSGSHYKLVFNQ